MAHETTGAATRVTITLEGGGRLAQVAQVLQVKLEARDLQWEPVDQQRLAVRGEIHSYLYFLRAGSRKIEGEGLAIPFSRTVSVPGLDLSRVDVAVEELVSDHDFDPVTCDFQHRIRVIVRVSERPRPEGETGEQGHRDIAEPIPSAPAQRDEIRLSEASGQTPLSQVRHGPSPFPEPEAEAAPPAPSEPPPSADEGQRVLVWNPFPPPTAGENPLGAAAKHGGRRPGRLRSWRGVPGGRQQRRAGHFSGRRASAPLLWLPGHLGGRKLRPSARLPERRRLRAAPCAAGKMLERRPTALTLS